MDEALKVGLLGCGVIGQGVLRLVKDAEGPIEARLGRPIRVQRVFLRQASKARGAVPAELVTSRAEDVLRAPDIDIVVELMGGVEAAGQMVEAALAAGKPVVTANKALIAERGHDLIRLAAERGVDLYYEGAVGGGIPVVRTLRESVASDRVLSIRGILNGTSNYILSQMSATGASFADALREAQQAGYAEADPTLDIGGFDAAHKLLILTTLAFGTWVDLRRATVEGITEVDAIDIQLAARFGYVFKPLAVAQEDADGALSVGVYPALVPETSIMAHVTDALNTVHIECAALGPCILTGRGAGAGPTAVSVVSDVVDVGRNLLTKAAGRVPHRAFMEERIAEARLRDGGERRGAYYLRFTVDDQPGVLAEIAGVLGKHAVSIGQLVQEAPEEAGRDVEIVLLTHRCQERNVDAALAIINALDHVRRPARRFRIEEA